nr:unnamed protein product [Callosobruchus analis]
MVNKPKLKEAFEVETKYGAFYTGGNVEWHEDILYCQTESSISLLNTDNGTVERTVGGQSSEDIDVIQTFTTDGRYIITSHRSGLFKMWNVNSELEKTWKYIHKGPVVKLALKGMKLASGGADSIVRLWDLQHQACQLGLKGCQGVVNVVEFHPDQGMILASGDDGKINCYELLRGELSDSYNAHYSKVTALVFSHDSKHFVTCGRDKVIILWEFGNNTALKTIPTYQAVEVIVSLPKKFKGPGFKAAPDGIYVASAGEKGAISIWELTKARQIYLQTNSLVTPAPDEGGLAVTHLRFHMKSKSLALVSVDQNIIIYHLKSFACLKQFIGFSDEILDITFVGKDDSYIAVATNSNDIKLYEAATMTCQLLKAHSDLVLALSTSKSNPDLMLSSSKDNTVRLWVLDGSTINCVAVGMRHTGSVGTVAFSNSAKFAVSASQDTCLKVWEISTQQKNGTLECLYTEIAHERDINCVAVSPNDKIIATSSQDKTAKLWTDTLSLVGVLRGHKRGVWSIRFSPVDQVVLTSSADCTIKLWSVADLSCLKTFEGHEASVLKAEFVSSGMQIVSTGADGLIKLFTIKSSECVCTLDQHEARVWALAIKKDESAMVTGGSDSILVKWKDVTEELKLRRLKEAEEMALQEQQLSNYLQSEEYLKALKLALRLDKPKQALRIVENIIKKGEGGLGETISGLRNDEKENLLKTVIGWNTNSRYCHPAQLVLNILLNEIQTGDFRPTGFGSSLEGALPYTERHFKRLTQLMQDLNFMTYMINCMTPHAKVSD